MLLHSQFLLVIIVDFMVLLNLIKENIESDSDESSLPFHYDFSAFQF